MRPVALRGEDPPDDAIVIVRGGEMTAVFARRTAEASYDEFGFYGISVFAAIDIGFEELCAAEPGLARYGKVRLSTAGRLRVAGFALLATLDRPHFDVVLPDLDDATLARLDAAFEPPIPNPARSAQG